MNFIKNNLVSLIVLILVAVLFLQRCGGNIPTVNTVKRDTVYSVQQVMQPPIQVPHYQPIIIESKAPTIIPPNYQPSTDQAVLLQQYQDLLNKFLTANKYNDSLILRDSTGKNVGVVRQQETVSENKIKDRAYQYQLQFPVRTEKITIKETIASKNQLYIGGGINGSKNDLVNSFDVGLILKNKHDQIFGIKTGITKTGEVNYGVQSYWKIRFPKIHF